MYPPLPPLPPKPPFGATAWGCGCDVDLGAVAPGYRGCSRSDPSPTGLLTFSSIVEQSAVTCGVVVTGRFCEICRGKDLAAIGGYKEVAASRCWPSTPPPPLALRSHPTSCPACCSVWASVLTHGHASLRPRNRPWFGAKPAQSLELEPATPGSQVLAHLGLGKKLGAGVAVPAWPLSLCQTGSQSSLPAEPVKESCGGRWLHTLSALPFSGLPCTIASVDCNPSRPCSEVIGHQMVPAAPTVQGHCRPVGKCEPRHRHTQHVPRNAKEE